MLSAMILMAAFVIIAATVTLSVADDAEGRQ